MYVLQVQSGAELEVLEQLRQLDLKGLVPRQTALIRRGGTWLEELKILLPGYVLIDEEHTPEVHYKVYKISGVIRWLGNPSKISDEEEKYMLWLAQFIRTPSEGYVDKGKLVIAKGILKGCEDMIASFNRRQKRAAIKLPLGGKNKKITLSVNIL